MTDRPTTAPAEVRAPRPPRRTRRRHTVLATLLGSGLVLASCSSLDSLAESSPSAAATEAEAVSATAAATDTTATTSTGGLFDETSVQDIAVTFDQAEYDAMIETFSSSGEKEWIHADVTINGVTYEDVGLRLKGNSSLMSLRNGGRTGGPGGTVSADDPSGLPWLIRLDEFVDDQSHDGVTELVVRANNSETSLNEAVALDLLEAAGLASEDATYARFTVNGDDAALRLITEVPNDEWAEENFATDGILYKAESGGDYSYRGDDPAAYDEVFEQETGDEDDLTPLISFLDFVNNATDEEFADQIDEHLDVEAFARYLAFEDLIGNSDDIDGPGNNSYLRIDAETGMVTVVAWDHNLAFGGMGAMGGPGGGGALPGGGLPGGGAMPGGTMPDGAAMPDGTMPDGAAMPEGAMPDGAAMPGGAGRGGPGGMRSQSNALVTRFKATEQGSALYDEALADLESELYGSGLADQVLAKWTSLLTSQASDLVDEATVESEASSIASRFTA